jgi:molybdopterin molybdotransferase
VLPVAEAIARILACSPELEPAPVPLDRAIGRVLREDVTAPHDYPPFHRVMMDGYAVVAADLDDRDTLPLHGESAAGTSAAPSLRPGTCVQVMTGAPLPVGADAVVMVEQTERVGDGVRFGAPVRAGQHYAVRGEEAREGQVIAAAGTVITPVTVSTLAHAGRAQVLCSRQPSLAIVTTGDELVPVDAEPGPNQIRDTNSWSLASQAFIEGLTDVRRLHAMDDEADLAATLTDAMTADIVVISGGVSMGKYDLVPGALQALGVEQVFHRVYSKPGKPVWFGRRGSTLIFGAPGNPLSTVVTFHMYVRPAIAKMSGRDPSEPRYTGRLVRDMLYRSKRDLFAFVRADWDGADLRITPLPGKGSADVFAPASANALLLLPAGTHDLKRDDEIAVCLLGPGPGR